MKKCPSLTLPKSDHSSKKSTVKKMFLDITSTYIYQDIFSNFSNFGPDIIPCRGPTCSRSWWWGWRCRWGWSPTPSGRDSSAASWLESGTDGLFGLCPLLKMAPICLFVSLSICTKGLNLHLVMGPLLEWINLICLSLSYFDKFGQFKGSLRPQNRMIFLFLKYILN